MGFRLSFCLCGQSHGSSFRAPGSSAKSLATKVMKGPQFGPVQHPHAKSEADAQRVVLSVLQGPK